jgi:hypothetical protein
MLQIPSHGGGMPEECHAPASERRAQRGLGKKAIYAKIH